MVQAYHSDRGRGKVTPLQRGPRLSVHSDEVRRCRFGSVKIPLTVDKRSLWQGAQSPGKFPDQEILPDEQGRLCGELDEWGELMPAGASGQAGFGIGARQPPPRTLR
jgi:hypothetical protein